MKSQAAVFAILVFFSISLAIVFGLSSLAVPEARNTKMALDAAKSYALGEAGIEDVAYRAITGKIFASTEILTLDGYSATITTTTLSDNKKEIFAKADVRGAVRKVKTVLEPGGAGVSFFYGVQVGDGGVTLGNGSLINGNIASNGDITGSGVSQTTITGTAQATGTHFIKKVNVVGDAYAYNLDSCIVGNTAFYVTTFTNCTAISTQVLPQPLAPQNFPISQAQIDTWKADAASGGTLNGYTLGNSALGFLGPKKIQGDVTLGNFSTLTLTGTVWVTGTISFGNSDIINLDAGIYGSQSGVLIVDGAMSIGNNAVLEGSGNPQSYLMLFSLAGPGTAMSIGNNANGAIFYAPNGVISVGNNLVLRQLTGYGLDIGNYSSITYETGLISTLFSSGPGGAYKVESWQEVP